MNIRNGRIDVHHHNIPPAFTQAMRERNIAKVAGAPLPEWNPRASIDAMDMNGIQTAITSLSAPGVHFGDGEEQAKFLARECNEFSARMVADYPGRFGSFAVLPMPFAEAACREAAYAFDSLGADGVVLLGSTDGIFLGDPSFEELMAELDRRAAVVFVHPNIHPSSGQVRLGIPDFFMEFLCDTTRAALNLILTGTMERYPRIKWILSHSGGFLPFIAWRASLGNAYPQYARNAPDGILSYIKRFYYDTALSPSRYSQAALKELVDPSRILFGSDYPFAPAPLVGAECRELSELGLWTEDEHYGINRGHALRLFPKYAQADEVPAPAPVFVGAGLGQRMRRGAGRAGAMVASMIQNR